MEVTFSDKKKDFTNQSLYHFGRSEIKSACCNERAYSVSLPSNTIRFSFFQHTNSCSTVCIEELGGCLTHIRDCKEKFLPVFDNICQDLYKLGISCILYTTGERYVRNYEELLKELGFVESVRYWNKQHDNIDKQIQMYKILAYDNKPL
jgi:hypothetical protein